MCSFFANIVNDWNNLPRDGADAKILNILRTVPIFVSAHTFCASRKPWFKRTLLSHIGFLIQNTSPVVATTAFAVLENQYAVHRYSTRVERVRFTRTIPMF